MAEDRLDRWERLEVEKRRKRAALAARVEAELPRVPFYPSVGPQWPSFEAWTAEQWRLALDPVENAKAALRAYTERRGPVRITNPANGRSVIAWQTDVTLPGSVWAMKPIIFDELQRWRSPWWARAMAWGIAVYYAVKR